MQTVNGTPNEQQRTAQWHGDKLGRFSCSQFYRLMTEPKLKADKEAGNLSDGAMTYVLECVAEKLTGQRAKEDFTSKYTEWGNDNEPIAAKIYEKVFELTCTDSGYIPYGENAGGSPDKLVSDTGVLEIKCPYTITSHLEHKVNQLIKKPEYYWQCLGYLLITNRQWIDFVSYHTAYAAKLQIVKQRITYTEVEADIKRLDAKITKATEVLNNILNTLK